MNGKNVGEMFLGGFFKEEGRRGEERRS